MHPTLGPVGDPPCSRQTVNPYSDEEGHALSQIKVKIMLQDSDSIPITHYAARSVGQLRLSLGRVCLLPEGPVTATVCAGRNNAMYACSFGTIRTQCKALQRSRD